MKNEVLTAKDAISYLVDKEVLDYQSDKAKIVIHFSDGVLITQDGKEKTINKRMGRITLIAIKSLIGLDIELCRSISITLDSDSVPIFSVDFVGTRKQIESIPLVVGDLCQLKE